MSKFQLKQRISIASKSLGNMVGTITGVSYSHKKDQYLYSAEIDVQKPSCYKTITNVLEQNITLLS